MKIIKPTELRLMRLRQGLSLRDIEELIGISRTTVLHWEYRGYVPAKHIKKVAAILHTDKEILFGLLMKAMADKMEKGDDK